jgi:hypothetical protein
MKPTYSYFAALAGAAVLAACGNVVVDGASGTGERTGTGGTSGIGGTTGLSGAGVGGGGGAGPCTLTSTGTSSGLQQVTACFAPSATTCPNQYDAANYIIPSQCTYLVSVDCGPVAQAGQCCYLVTQQVYPCGGP